MPPLPSSCWEGSIGQTLRTLSPNYGFFEPRWVQSFDCLASNDIKFINRLTFYINSRLNKKLRKRQMYFNNALSMQIIKMVYKSALHWLVTKKPTFEKHIKLWKLWKVKSGEQRFSQFTVLSNYNWSAMVLGRKVYAPSLISPWNGIFSSSQ